MEKLKLNRETLKVLTETETRQVAGGLKAFSEIAGCSEGGGVCTSHCPTRPSEVFSC